MLNKLENFEMEKFNELNMKILEDDGTANLKEIMRDIMKEILKEQEEQKKKGIIMVNTNSTGEKSSKRGENTAKNKTNLGNS